MHTISSFFKWVMRWLYTHIAKEPEDHQLAETEHFAETGQGKDHPLSLREPSASLAPTVREVPSQPMSRQAGTEPLPPRTAEGLVEPTPLPRSSEEETSDVLQNKAWFKLVQECITLFDKLDRTGARMDPQRQELAGYVCSQLEEILERSGVRIISGDVSFDEHLHLPEPAMERVAPGTAIAETLSSGFAVGSRVLRHAHVRLKEQSSGGKRALESREHIEKEQHS